MCLRTSAIGDLSGLELSDSMSQLRNIFSVTGITTIAAVGAGLAGGVFFAFSSFIMPALRRLPSGAGHRRDAVHQPAGAHSGLS